MSKPTSKMKNMLKDLENDAEAYHSNYDALLEMKLYELDREWMTGMREIYNKSGCSRWCA